MTAGQATPNENYLLWIKSVFCLNLTFTAQSQASGGL